MIRIVKQKPLEMDAWYPQPPQIQTFLMVAILHRANYLEITYPSLIKDIQTDTHEPRKLYMGFLKNLEI